MQTIGDDEKLAKAVQRTREYRASFPLFAEQCLKIRDKGSKVVPFVMNHAQLYIHERIEKQRAAKGWVRVLILKGRQQGASTYTEGRYYWKTSLYRNVSTFILSHEQAAADALFQMVDRFHRSNPVAPRTGKSNIKELAFDRLDSVYAVATAGSKAAGRGKTFTLFHGSEVGFWKNDTDHFAASVQAVPLMPGTEIILESTANGTEGEFWKRAQDAMRGIGDYELIFIPWFWSPEYSRVPEDSFELDVVAEEGELSEQETADLFELSLGQMCWRRSKISELGSLGKFKQEYPSTPDEAFQSAERNGLISSLDVLRARKRKIKGAGPLIIGVDPAGDGGDRFAVAFRRGYKCEKIDFRTKIDEPEALAWIMEIIDTYNPAAVFIDSGGIGRYLISFLRAAGPKYAAVVHSVNFGAKSQHKHAKPKVAGPINRRAEMWERMKRWLKQEDGVQIPDDDALHADLTSSRIKPTLNNDLQLMSKQEMRTKGLSSPDMADALALTFADMVYFAEWTETKKPPTFEVIDGAQEVVYHDTPQQILDGSGNAGHGNGWMGY